MRRRVLAFLTMVVMLLSLCAVPAFAATDEAIMEVTSLGILKGDGDGNLRLEDDVTRGEFATLVTRLLNYDSLVIGRKTMFSDVPETHVHAGAIALISEFGYINGDGNGHFYPNNPITVQDCLKILVCALGYELDAKAKGGYPAGYLATATRLKINKGLERSIRENATRGDVAMMIYQALYVNILEPYATTDGDFTFSGDNFKHRFEFHEDIYHTTGIVTANYDTWLGVPNANIARDEIEVNGVVYKVGNINTRPYLGRLVEVYYHKEPSGRKTILNLALSQKNSQTIIDKDDYINLDGNQINYRDEERNRETVLIDRDKTVFVYNNRIPTGGYVLSDLLNITQGRFECVSNNWDDVCEYVFIYDYESSIVDRVNPNGCIYLKQDLKIAGRDNIVIDANSRNITYNLMDVTGRKLDLTQVNPGDVVTVYKSIDGSIIDIVISTKTITGTVDRFANSGRKVEIGGSLYGFINNFSSEDLVIGNSVIAYVNEFDKLVYVEAADDSAYKYGYILDYGSVSGLGGTMQARILVSGYMTTVVEKDEVANENDPSLSEGTEKTISSLDCKNSEVIYADFAERVKFSDDLTNNRMTSISELFDRPDFCADIETYPVKFKINADGKISVLEIVTDLVGGVGNLYINETKPLEKTFGFNYNSDNATFHNTAHTPFGVNADTKVICVPTTDATNMSDIDKNATDAKLLSLYRISPGTTETYHVGGYVVDEDTKCVELLVLKAVLKESATVKTLERNGEYALVKETYLDFNEDGEEIKVAKLITKSGEVDITVAPTMITAEDNYGFQDGDFICYITDYNGAINKAKVINSLGGMIYEEMPNSYMQSYYSVTGRVQDIERLKITESAGSFIGAGERYHSLITNTGGECMYRVLTNAAVIIYDKRNEEMTLGTFDDVMYEDLVCIAAKGSDSDTGVIAALVVIRGE